MSVHINRAGGLNLRRKQGRCWGACEIADAPLVRNVPGSPYYGDDWTCTICGDGWTVEPPYAVLHERPFQRGWRVKAIARAVQRWEDACECPVERDSDLYVVPCEHSRERAA